MKIRILSLGNIAYYVFTIVAIFMVANVTITAQKKVKTKSPYTSVNSPKIDPAKPSVSITPSEPALTHYGDDYFILSMHNNYVWDIRVCSYDPIDTKTNTAGISYALETISPSTVTNFSHMKQEKSVEKPQYFIGTNTHFCRLITIPSGKSIFFPVPKAHAQQNGTDIMVNFLLPWENYNKWQEMQETTHIAKFRLSTLRKK